MTASTRRQSRVSWMQNDKPTSDPIRPTSPPSRHALKRLEEIVHLLEEGESG